MLHFFLKTPFYSLNGDCLSQAGFCSLNLLLLGLDLGDSLFEAGFEEILPGHIQNINFLLHAWRGGECTATAGRKHLAEQNTWGGALCRHSTLPEAIAPLSYHSRTILVPLSHHLRTTLVPLSYHSHTTLEALSSHSLAFSYRSRTTLLALSYHSPINLVYTSLVPRSYHSRTTPLPLS